MPSPAAPKAPSGISCAGSAATARGSAAVEFALVAPVFFALLFAIIEVAIMFFASQVLETITQDSARVLMTGQAQTGQVTCADPVSGAPAACTQATFQTYVCSQIPALFTCSQRSTSTSRAIRSFSNVVINSQIDGSGNFISANMQYSPGGPGDTVVVRMFYQWPLFVTGLGYNICEFVRQQAAAGRHGGIPERTLLSIMDEIDPMKIWCRARLSAHALLNDGRGVAAIEFAMIVPIMLVMFFGTVEFSSGVAVNRKVTLMAQTFSDLVSRNHLGRRRPVAEFFQRRRRDHDAL